MGRQAVGAVGAMIRLEKLRSFPVEEFLLTRIALAPDASRVALGHKAFRTLNAETGGVEREFAYGEFLGQLRYSPDGRYLAAVNVADNHPATRGRVTVFEAASGAAALDREAALPVETCAFQAGESGWQIAWNDPRLEAAAEGGAAHIAGRIARAELGGNGRAAALEPLALGPQQIRSLAAGAGGFTCFVREAVGSEHTVENAQLVFRKFRLLSVAPGGQIRRDLDLGIGAGVCALSPDGKLLAVEMVDFKNNERHVSVVDAETGVEANLLPLEANTLPVLEFSQDGAYFLCLKEDAEGDFNTLRLWRTADLKLVGEAQLDLSYHAVASCLEHSTLAFLGGGKLDLFAIE
ncbi:MAG: hypothetical protein ACRD2F_09055 [Terriglobales bacterium]